MLQCSKILPIGGHCTLNYAQILYPILHIKLRTLQFLENSNFWVVSNCLKFTIEFVDLYNSYNFMCFTALLELLPTDHYIPFVCGSLGGSGMTTQNYANKSYSYFCGMCCSPTV